MVKQQAAAHGGVSAQIKSEREETYAGLLHRAVVDPESLTAEDHARLEPGDRQLIIDAIDRELAKVDAELHGFKVRDPRVGDKRQRELIALARTGALRYADLSIDEIRAIDNTPGLSDAIWEAMP